MKAIKTTKDLEEALACLQILPEAEFVDAFSDLFTRIIDVGGVKQRMELINHCLGAEIALKRKDLLKLVKRRISREKRQPFLDLLNDENRSLTVCRTRASIVERLRHSFATEVV